MRLHPPAFGTERHCTKAYTLPGTNVVIPKGTRIAIPIRQVQRDPKYYPNPMKFNPKISMLKTRQKDIRSPTRLLGKDQEIVSVGAG